VPDLVDLRSDTVTQPTPAMRRAMAEADVGDDDYGEDPTVRALEEAFAARVGKPAALFVASGVMANQVAFRVLSRPGTAVVAGRRQHVVAYEYGAAAKNAGIQFIGLDDGGGTIQADDVLWARQAADHHQPAVSLISIENTHMAASGAPWSLDA
jgi:threonine aldolase